MRRDLTTEQLEQLDRLVYDATISELADIIHRQHRDTELELLIELIQEKRKKESQND